MGANNSCRHNVDELTLKRFHREIAGLVVRHFKDVELKISFGYGNEVVLRVDKIESVARGFIIHFHDDITTQLLGRMEQKKEEGYLFMKVGDKAGYFNLDSIKAIEATNHGESKSLMEKFVKNHNGDLAYQVKHWKFTMDYNSNYASKEYIMNVEL